MLDNENTQPSTFRIENWVEITDDRHGTYNKKNIKFNTATFQSSTCYYAIHT